MLKFAIETYKHRFQGDEIKTVLTAMKRLEALAEVRNQIAHGHCSQQTATVDGEVVASGNYLLPSLNESRFHERSIRFNHIPDTINAFTMAVREHRGKIMDVSLALQVREQEHKNGAGYMLDHHVKRIATKEVVGQEALRELREFLKWAELFAPAPLSADNEGGKKRDRYPARKQGHPS